MVGSHQTFDPPLMFHTRLHVFWALTAVAMIAAGVGLVITDEAVGYACAVIVWGLGSAAIALARPFDDAPAERCKPRRRSAWPETGTATSGRRSTSPRRRVRSGGGDRA
jgi:hypothetical protein